MTVIYFLENRAEDLERFKFLLVFVGIFTLLLASIEHFKQIIYKPWKLKRILNKTPFLEFQNKGFLKEENYLKGNYNKYSIILGLQWESYQARPGYYFMVLFNPFVNGSLLSQNECDRLNEEFDNKKSRFTLNSIVKYYGQRKLFLRTEYKDIVNDLNQSIDFLKSRKIEPVSFSEWKSYVPKVERHAEKFVYQ